MPTYDYTGDAVAGAHPPTRYEGGRSARVDLYKRLKVSEIIASDAQMVSDGYIASDDIIQAIHVPIGFLFQGALVRIITPCTATVDVEVGVVGGAEAIAAFDADGSVGAAKATADDASWEHGKYFASADTIDVQFITANCLVGELELFVWGTQIVIGLTTDFTTGA